jgi:hypothetical protein
VRILTWIFWKHKWLAGWRRVFWWAQILRLASLYTEYVYIFKEKLIWTDLSLSKILILIQADTEVFWKLEITFQQYLSRQIRYLLGKLFQVIIDSHTPDYITLNIFHLSPQIWKSHSLIARSDYAYISYVRQEMSRKRPWDLSCRAIQLGRITRVGLWMSVML